MKHRINASPISKISKEDLEKLTLKSESFTEILRSLGLPNVGNSSNSLKRRLTKEKIDFTHLLRNHKTRSVNTLKKESEKSKLPIEDYLVIGRLQTSRTNLKARLIKENLLENKCSVCGITEWLEKPISLDIHHKNGINNDNRLENLCLLCPNCHRQTDTFGGKNTRKFPHPDSNED